MRPFVAPRPTRAGVGILGRVRAFFSDSVELAPLVDLSPWLRLRWGLTLLPLVVVGLGLAGSDLVQPPSPPAMGGLLLLSVGVAAANRVLSRQLASRDSASERLLLGAFLGDALLLTVVLGTAGGASNPLTSLYLVPVILGSLLLRPRAAWTVLAATAFGYALLFRVHGGGHAHHGEAMAGHFRGMFVAYAITAALVVYAVLKSRHALREAEARSRAAQGLRDRTERLTALATLAAGASHELATPLSTILVVARELEVRAQSDDDCQDARLIHAEVLRCREILHQLAADSGAGMGEVPRRVPIAELLASAVRDDPRVSVEPCAGDAVVPPKLVGQALRRLVGNAREASRTDQAVRVSVEVEAAAVCFVVADRGVGMDAATLAKATEPFFSTRAEGEGTGLGLYFVDAVAEHLGGALTLASTPGAGTTARLTLPQAEVPAP